MAQCHCRWRRVLICVCTACFSLVLLVTYVTAMLCVTMDITSVPGTEVHDQKTVHFVASGNWNNKSFAPHPKTFWELNLHGVALWNRIQLTNDRHCNPILNPNIIKREFENCTFNENQQKQGFSEVTNLDSMTDFDKLPQQMQDFISNMQRRDYPILLQPDGVCGAGATDEKEPPLLLLAIKSSGLNFKNRQAIRQTWGQTGWVAGQKSKSNVVGDVGGYVRRVFLLGKEDTEELGVDLSDILQIESKHYGDILQWDFRDTFFNLNLKDVLFWSWFSRSCSQTRFVFKGDDDIFVNTPKMITYLQEHLKTPQANTTMKDFIVGYVINAAEPFRNTDSKYFIPYSFYKGLYPMYASGGGVVYSGLLTKHLHDVSKRVNLFPIDDVYLGMCLIRLNTQPVHHPGFIMFDFRSKVELCSYHKILMVHKRSPEQIVKLWADMKKTEEQCWDVPLRQTDELKD